MPRLVERDRAALRSRAQSHEPVVEAERARRERRDDRGREEGAGEHSAAHLLLHHHGVDESETQAALLLGDEETGPSEVDDAPPQLGRDPRVVVLRHAAHVLLRRLGSEEGAHRVAQCFLFGREREVHTFTVVRP